MAARSRSKSPARATRSKTPTRAAAAKAVATKAVAKAVEIEHDPNVQLAIAVAVLVAVWSQTNGGDGSPNLPGFAAAAAGGFQFNYPSQIASIPIVGTLFARYFGGACNLVLALHVLNTVSSNATRSGYWLNNFAQVSIAAFAGLILPAVLGGKNMIDAVFDNHGMEASSFFLVWYVVNYDIPFCPAPMGIWSTISDVGGDALQILLALGSTLFTTNIVIGASGGAQELFSSAWGVALITGVVTGTAGSFFPLNKGFKLAKSDEATNAFNISFFLASNGFAFLDSMVNLALSLVKDCTMGKVDLGDNYADIAVGAKVNGFVEQVFGSLAAFVVTVVVLNQLFGHLVPMDTGKGFDVFNLMGHVMTFFNL